MAAAAAAATEEWAAMPAIAPAAAAVDYLQRVETAEISEGEILAAAAAVPRILQMAIAEAPYKVETALMAAQVRVERGDKL